MAIDVTDRKRCGKKNPEIEVLYISIKELAFTVKIGFNYEDMWL